MCSLIKAYLFITSSFLCLISHLQSHKQHDIKCTNILFSFYCFNFIFTGSIAVKLSPEHNVVPHGAILHVNIKSFCTSVVKWRRVLIIPLMLLSFQHKNNMLTVTEAFHKLINFYLSFHFFPFQGGIHYQFRKWRCPEPSVNFAKLALRVSKMTFQDQNL